MEACTDGWSGVWIDYQNSKDLYQYGAPHFTITPIEALMLSLRARLKGTQSHSHEDNCHHQFSRETLFFFTATRY